MSVDGVVAAQPLFQGEGGGSIPTSTLRFVRTSRKRFSRLNREWHSVLPHIGAINTMKVCFAADHDGVVYAVAAWSNPVARELDQKTVMELRRFAISPHRPPNTGSRMLAWMAREIFRTFAEVQTLVSYQDASIHRGTIYRAAGWKPVELTAWGGPWKNRDRWNRTAVRRRNKIRWEMTRR